MSQSHNGISEAAHGGHAKTYNRIAAIYYWPKMAREIKKYVSTCDICQKAKPQRHAPAGLLQPIPIPSQPFEVVTMDFIPELPLSEGYDNILVIVDKLTKYAIFIPTTVNIAEVETARFFFHHVISQFGIPKQIITDQDTRWKGDFWLEICNHMGMKCALTTSYHPQADGQTEVMNQGLEIALHAYIGPSRNDWASHLGALALSYNSTPHTTTGFAPAYLLRGYVPITGTSLIHSKALFPRISDDIVGSTLDNRDLVLSRRPEAELMHEQADRHRAQEALTLSQHYQRKAYNKGRLIHEFDIRDLVLINPHSLSLLRNETERGKKLLMKYDGPFKVLEKLSPVTY